MIIQWGNFCVQAESSVAILMLAVPVMILMLAMEIVRLIRSRTESKLKTDKRKQDKNNQILESISKWLQRLKKQPKQEDIMARIKIEEYQNGNGR